jgi:hypothetical protein
VTTNIVHHATLPFPAGWQGPRCHILKHHRASGPSKSGRKNARDIQIDLDGKGPDGVMQSAL